MMIDLRFRVLGGESARRGISQGVRISGSVPGALRPGRSPRRLYAPAPWHCQAESAKPRVPKRGLPPNQREPSQGGRGKSLPRLGLGLLKGTADAQKPIPAESRQFPRSPLGAIAMLPPAVPSLAVSLPAVPSPSSGNARQHRPTAPPQPAKDTRQARTPAKETC